MSFTTAHLKTILENMPWTGFTVPNVKVDEKFEELSRTLFIIPGTVEHRTLNPVLKTRTTPVQLILAHDDPDCIDTLYTYLLDYPFTPPASLELGFENTLDGFSTETGVSSSTDYKNSGSYSLKILSNGGDRTTTRTVNSIPSPTITETIQFYILAHGQSGDNTTLCRLRMLSGTTLVGYFGMYYVNATTRSFLNGTTTHAYAWTSDTWYKITIVNDYLDKETSVYVDDVLLSTVGFYLSGTSTSIDSIQFIGYNASMDAPYYIDDLTITYTNTTDLGLPLNVCNLDVDRNRVSIYNENMYISRINFNIIELEDIS